MLPTSHPEFVASLRQADLLTPDQWTEIISCPEDLGTPLRLSEWLVNRGWLTPYQGSCLLQDQVSRLVLGGYRLLEPIGAGGQGEVLGAVRPGQATRPRPRPPRYRRFGRRVDRRPAGSRHAGLYLAGTGPRFPPRRHPLGPLQPRLYLLLPAHRPSPVPGRDGV